MERCRKRKRTLLLLLMYNLLCEEEDEEAWLDSLDRHHRQDILEGKVVNRRRQPEERWWYCEGRHLDSKRFYGLFRMMRPTFQRLVEALYGTTKWRKTFGPGFDPCERVALTLFRLGQADTVQSTSALFQMSEGSVSEITMSVVDLILSNLEEDYVQWPTIPEQEAMSREWEREKILRGIIGAMDGSHIKIDSPPPKISIHYYNYKQFTSVVLLGVVGPDCSFTFVNAGAPGGCSDGGIWRASGLCDASNDDVKLPASERSVLGEGKVILGDSAFAEVDASMRTPYDNPIAREKRLYNYLHSSARLRVEHAFGMLKEKFPCLSTGLPVKLDNAGKVITACVVMYNFMLRHEGMRSEPREQVHTPQPAATGSAAGVPPRRAGTARDLEAAYLAENHMLRVFGEPGSRLDRLRRAEERRQRRRTRIQRRRQRQRTTTSS